MKSAILGGCYTLLGGGMLAAPPARAQEMPAGKGPVFMAELGQGFNRSSGGNTLYLATLQVAPQWTVVPERLRLGPVVGVFYPGTRVGALAGGRATLKVIEGQKFLLASSFHVHLLGEYLPAVWTHSDTWRQWVGVGIGLETSSLLGVAFKVHRDFQTPTTYGQFTLALNLRYKAFQPPTNI
ncbi:hypothetical protein GO988_14505 [Hymenobacter sp. HMF4947]|uniref:Outer membrane protein beta-barrel domain-containing protein n=1 Tax=Hymenobacter ginkgonis TaxID=2682976 RepID=A0A7K1TGN6_9BACT|nr:hypothetical protein [Hymenobacter ginkgonis]MVN77544.1 hypothetical protein [Hymenobacter ginkgonis]